MIQTTIYRKQTDRQNYLHARSEHPKLLKDSMPYSQALRIKRICSSQQEFLNHTAKIINQFQKRGHDRSLIEQQINKVNLQERKQLLNEKKKETAKYISLSFKYNITLPKIKEIVMTLASSAHKTKFRNKNLRDIIGTKLSQKEIYKQNTR